MKKTQSRVKKIIIIGLAIIILAVLILKIDSLFITQNKITINTSEGMTVKQRKQDFDDLCKTIENNVPFIYDYEDLYGISFESVKDYYSKLIENTENDYEYYALIQGFINNIPSGHMTIGYPNTDYIPSLYTYRTNDYTNFSYVCNYWENKLKEECRKYYNENDNWCVLPYYYVNGEYIQSESFTLNNNTGYSSSKLISVDNIPIDDFIKLCPLESKIIYDHQNNKASRGMILFNNICGKECTIQYEDKNGNMISQKMYYGTSGSIVMNFIDYFYSLDYPKVQEEQTAETTENSDALIYTCYDDVNNAMYIKFNDFTYGGAEALKEFDKIDIPDNIIIDLRDNTGGYAEVCDKLIERLSDKSFEYTKEVYITPDSNYDGSGYIAQQAENLPFKTRYKQLYTDIRNEKFEGKSERIYNIYVLVSPDTLSAADRFTAVMKDNNLATIVGAFNTGGEAYGSPDLKVLETSGIYFYFTENKSLNKDGTDNSVYGTSPNVYVNLNKETLNKRDELIAQGIDYRTYENRLKWDNVLIETIEMIKEDENDKGNNTPAEPNVKSLH